MLTDEDDNLVWMYNSSGRYSSQSLYKIVNFRGVQQIITPAVWKLNIPSRVQIFFWLVSKNKILTRDNVAKRKHIEDGSGLFCSENESIHHLFFECAVAHRIWCDMSECCGVNIGANYESVARS